MSFDTLITSFAATESAESVGILEGLGIDWQLLVFQAVAFLILVWALGKWVYPIFMRIIDERQAKIDESVAAAVRAEDNANEAQAKIDKQLATARREAREIVATAKDEANSMLARADEKAKSQADNTLASARDEIAKEVIAAKKSLERDTIDLVARATEAVIGKTHTSKADKSVITDALKEAK